MSGAGFYRGTSHEQDARFQDKEAKLLKQLKFPPEYDVKIDMEKIQLEHLKGWISNRITDLMGAEDEVVENLCINMLEEERYPNPKRMQIDLTGFLERNSKIFTLELWRKLINAMNSVSGIADDILNKIKNAELEKLAENESIKENISRRRHRIEEERTIKIQKSRSRSRSRSQNRKRKSRFSDKERVHSHSRSRSHSPKSWRRNRQSPIRDSRKSLENETQDDNITKDHKQSSESSRHNERSEKYEKREHEKRHRVLSRSPRKSRRSPSYSISRSRSRDDDGEKRANGYNKHERRHSYKSRRSRSPRRDRSHHSVSRSRSRGRKERRSHRERISHRERRSHRERSHSRSRSPHKMPHSPSSVSRSPTDKDGTSEYEIKLQETI